MILHNFQRWISPLILTIISQQAIRLVTDISMDNTFWITPVQHLKEFIISLPFCYFLDWRMRKFLGKGMYDYNKGKEIIKEYALWAVYFFIGIVIFVFTAHQILNLTEYFRDYVFAVVTCVPILLFYYTLIRNDLVQRRLGNQNLQLEKIKAAKLEVDLKFLKAQYHPHFLFNALNTVYFQMEDKNVQAKESLEILSELLRYQLYGAEKQVTLEEEVSFLKTYIRFQKLRIDEGVVVNLSIKVNDNKVKLHSLLFQPLLENAFKYVDGENEISIQISQQNNVIIFKVINSIAVYNRNEKGIGIKNLKQRLSILYSEKHTLSATVEDNFYIATLIIETQ